MLKEQIRKKLLEKGFDLVGFVKPEASRFRKEVQQWIDEGMHGDMRWFADTLDRRFDVHKVMEGVRSVIVCAVAYPSVPELVQYTDDPSRGIFARYALYDDYHTVLQNLLESVVSEIKKEVCPNLNARVYVDTGPILERELAFAVGLGYSGKNTNIINIEKGSYLLLSEILCDIDLEPDPTPKYVGSCGACTRCQSACPTQAFVEPWRLDARRCISYLTIEHRGVISYDLAPLIKNRIFGCDICQEVCPWNQKSKSISSKVFTLRHELLAPHLLDLVNLTPTTFSTMFKNSPVKRTKYQGLMRNILIAIANWGSADALPYVLNSTKDEQPLVRATALYALKTLWIKNKVHPDTSVLSNLEKDEDELVRGEFQSLFRSGK